MLISRVADRASKPSSSGGYGEMSIGDRKGSLTHLKSMLYEDISKTVENRSYIHEFTCQILNDSESDWIPSSMAIKENGIAEVSQIHGSKTLGEIKLPQSTVIGHLGRHLIQITTDTYTWLLDCTPDIFVSVYTTLLLWARLRPSGVNNKLWLPPAQSLNDQDADLLRCEVEVHFTVYNPQYARWSPFLARLKRSGEIQLSDSQSQVIYTLQVHQVLGSRIKAVDYSVVDSKMVLLLFPDLGGPESVYLKFSDIDDFEDWIATLNSFSLQPVSTPLSHDPRQSIRWYRNLTVDISSCRQNNSTGTSTVPVNLTDTYVDVCISRWVFARTCLNSDSKTANWSQSFDIFEPDLAMPQLASPSQLELKLKQRKSSQSTIGSEQDITLGSITLPKVTASASRNSYSLNPSNLLLDLSIQYSEVVILHSSYYTKLYEWMSDLDIRLPSRLVIAAPSSLPKLFPLFNRIYRAQGRQLEWILSLASDEIQSIDINSDTMFREASLFTRAMESILQQQGEETLQRTIGRFVRKLIVGTNESLELDPSRHSNPEDIKKNTVAMGHFMNYLWSLIKSEGPPSISKPIFRHIKSELQKRAVPEDQLNKATSRIVSSLLFLRFYVPALLNPQIYNLTDRTLYPAHRRTLVLVAKILQSFANKVKFGSKEMWLTPMNSFMEEHEEELASWYHEICGYTNSSLGDGDLAQFSDCDRPPKELPVETFMGQQLTSPNLVDEWGTYAQLVCAITGGQSQLAITFNSGSDTLVDEVIAECYHILGTHNKILGALERADTFQDSAEAPTPHVFLNPVTMLFGTNENQLDPGVAKPKRSNSSLSEGFSRFGWFPKNKILNDESDENRQRGVGSVRKLTQMLRISKSSSSR